MSKTRIMVLTGAGISVAAGLRPYRGPGGIWTEQNVAELSTARAFAENPARCAEFWGGMARAVAEVQPTAAHLALAALEAQYEVVIATQNVDGLHQAAGSSEVLELHGSMRRWRCACGDQGDELLREFTQCECGGWRRPFVVLFDEPLPSAPLRRAREVAESCAVLLCVGTSLLVSPASLLPSMAHARGAGTVYVGLEAPEYPDIWGDIRIGKAEEVVPRLVEESFGVRGSAGGRAQKRLLRRA